MHGVNMNQCSVDDFKATIITIEGQEKIRAGQEYSLGALLFAAVRLVQGRFGPVRRAPSKQC
jgi:hypothetical protein